jgi:hypothetical protein
VHVWINENAVEELDELAMFIIDVQCRLLFVHADDGSPARTSSHRHFPAVWLLRTT